MQLHKSIGITVLLLTLLRIGWRLGHAAAAAAGPHARLGALGGAGPRTSLFYVLMLGMPLSGWAMVSASPLIQVHPTVLFGVVPWPTMPFRGIDARPAARPRASSSGTTHDLLALARLRHHRPACGRRR